MNLARQLLCLGAFLLLSQPLLAAQDVPRDEVAASLVDSTEPLSHRRSRSVGATHKDLVAFEAALARKKALAKTLEVKKVASKTSRRGRSRRVLPANGSRTLTRRRTDPKGIREFIARHPSDQRNTRGKSMVRAPQQAALAKTKKGKKKKKATTHSRRRNSVTMMTPMARQVRVSTRVAPRRMQRSRSRVRRSLERSKTLAMSATPSTAPESPPAPSQSSSDLYTGLLHDDADPNDDSDTEESISRVRRSRTNSSPRAPRRLPTRTYINGTEVTGVPIAQLLVQVKEQAFEPSLATSGSASGDEEWADLGDALSGLTRVTTNPFMQDVPEFGDNESEAEALAEISLSEERIAWDNLIKSAASTLNSHLEWREVKGLTLDDDLVEGLRQEFERSFGSDLTSRWLGTGIGSGVKRDPNSRLRSCLDFVDFWLDAADIPLFPISLLARVGIRIIEHFLDKRMVRRERAQLRLMAPGHDLDFCKVMSYVVFSVPAVTEMIRLRAPSTDDEREDFILFLHQTVWGIIDFVIKHKYVHLENADRNIAAMKLATQINRVLRKPHLFLGTGILKNKSARELSRINELPQLN